MPRLFKFTALRKLFSLKFRFSWVLFFIFIVTVGSLRILGQYSTYIYPSSRVRTDVPKSQSIYSKVSIFWEKIRFLSFGAQYNIFEALERSKIRSDYIYRTNFMQLQDLQFAGTVDAKRLNMHTDDEYINLLWKKSKSEFKYDSENINDIVYPVCVLGNAQSVKSAELVRKTWPYFPIFLSVWGENPSWWKDSSKNIPVGARILEKSDILLINTDVDPKGHTVLESTRELELFNHPKLTLIQAPKSTHAEGWEFALRAAKASSYTCEYYFTLDDDLIWSSTKFGLSYFSSVKRFFRKHPDIMNQDLKPSNISLKSLASLHIRENIEKATLTDILLSYLLDYRPAITVFNWPWGENHHKPFKYLIEKYRNTPPRHELDIPGLVQPATMFDNGCLVFDKSIVDFFIPLWLGKGISLYTINELCNSYLGHPPKFISQHAYLNYFIPLVFQQHALRFEGIRFLNPPSVRHPYDDVSKFNGFFSKGMRCKSWSAGLISRGLSWSSARWSERGSKDFGSNEEKFNHDLYLEALKPERLALIFNLHHSTLLDNPWLRKSYQLSELEEIDRKVLVEHAKLCNSTFQAWIV